jgi:hypothetical protein
MHTLKTLARLIAPAALTLGVAANEAAAQTAPAAPLTLQVYNADANSFHVNAVRNVYNSKKLGIYVTYKGQQWVLSKFQT